MVDILCELTDNWLTKSVESSYNALDAFKLVFKSGFFSLIVFACET